MKKEHRKKITVGFSKKNISVCLQKERPIKSPIQIVAFSINTNDSSYIWLCLDLMDISKASIDYLRGYLAERALFVFENIHILSTHNHGGGDIEDYDLPMLAKVVAESAIESRNTAQEAYVSYAKTEINEQVNYLRRVYSEELQGKTTIFWGPSPENNYDAGAYLQNSIDKFKKALLHIAVRQKKSNL